MKIIRGELTPAALTPPSTRYNATCDCIQVTTDDGTTWVEAVGQDPRHQPAYLKPPVAGSSKQCDSAANMVKWIHDFMDEIIAALAAGAQAIFAANTLISFLERLFPFAAYFIELVFEAAVDLFGRGSTALDAAFDSTTYTLLLCIFYCHTDSDGRISAHNLTLAEADIVAHLNTTAAAVVNEILFIQGEIGLSNAGAIGSETGDCTSCACIFCYSWDFTIESYAADGWAVEAPYGQYAAGQGWQSHSGDGLILDLTFPSAHEITSVQWGGTAFGGTGPYGRAVLYTFGGATIYNSNQSGLGNPYTQDVEHTATVEKLRFNPYGGSDADVYIQHVLITSTLEIPEWAARAC